MSAELVRPYDGKVATGGDPILASSDVKVINAQMARRKKLGNRRPKFASFRVPVTLTRLQYEQYRNNAVNKWIDDEAKHGWDLKSRVIDAPERATEATQYSGDFAIALPGFVEVPVAAMFEQQKVKNQRIEVAVAT